VNAEPRQDRRGLIGDQLEQARAETRLERERGAGVFGEEIRDPLGHRRAAPNDIEQKRHDRERDRIHNAVADRVLMMENAVYSVISPEGCASIMWRDATKKDLAAEAMKITAKDLNELGCIDAIIPEPAGGAHTDHALAASMLDTALLEHLAAIRKLPVGELLDTRYKKFRNMAQFFQVEA